VMELSKRCPKDESDMELVSDGGEPEVFFWQCPICQLQRNLE
jgi:hypothetical protein